MPHPRASSLTICTSSAHKWRVPRPPTPRRQTFPGAQKPPFTNNIDINIPPVPTLSYFERDTPIETLSSPILLPPRNNRFLGFSPVSPCDTLFPGFGPASPSVYSPVSPKIFLHAYRYPGSLSHQHQTSPLSPVHLFSCIPSCEPSPMSPRFLFPRTPPLPHQLSQPPQTSQQISRLRSQTLAQAQDEPSPTSYCFGMGMGGRRQSTPYYASSLALCGHSDGTPRTPEHENVPQKMGWSSLETPVGLYFKKMGADKKRKKALQQRRFKMVEIEESVVVVITIV